jgi:uncharacterized protein with PhoU and TrkA domain
VALKDSVKGSYAFNPQRTTVLAGDHTLVVMGHVDAIHEMRERVKPAP